MSMVDGVVLLVDASEVPYKHISVHTDEYVCMYACMYVFMVWYIGSDVADEVCVRESTGCS